MRYLPLALLIVACLGLLREPEWREDLTALCDEPQKTFFMSFNAMSKRDSIGNAFDEINSKISLKSLTHVDAGTTYFIMNLRANLSYSEYYQKDQFVDKYEAKVILGTIEIGVLFDYKI